MNSKERGFTRNHLISAGALGASILTIATGCGGNGPDAKSIVGPCPSGYEGTGTVLDQKNIVDEFKSADTGIVNKWKNNPYPDNPRVGEALAIAFYPKMAPDLGMDYSDSANRTNDPQELMCTTESGDVVLSPHAELARAVFAKAGVIVNLKVRSK